MHNMLKFRHIVDISTKSLLQVISRAFLVHGEGSRPESKSIAPSALTTEQQAIIGVFALQVEIYT